MVGMVICVPLIYCITWCYSAPFDEAWSEKINYTCNQFGTSVFSRHRHNANN